MTVTPDQMIGFLRDTAEAGLRCPTAVELAQAFGSVPYAAALGTLAKRGLLTVYVYGKNWRVVEIDGVRTAPPPHGGEPYRVLNADGDNWVTHNRMQKPLPINRRAGW